MDSNSRPVILTYRLAEGGVPQLDKGTPIYLTLQEALIVGNCQQQVSSVLSLAHLKYVRSFESLSGQKHIRCHILLWGVANNKVSMPSLGVPNKGQFRPPTISLGGILWRHPLTNALSNAVRNLNHAYKIQSSHDVALWNCWNSECSLIQHI